MAAAPAAGLVCRGSVLDPVAVDATAEVDRGGLVEVGTLPVVVESLVTRRSQIRLSGPI